MRGRTSSVEYVSDIRSENSLSTSYGVARLPYTMRSATERAAWSTGRKVSATSTTPKTSRDRLPTVATATNARYRPVRDRATSENVTPFFTTRSMSYRR